MTLATMSLGMQNTPEPGIDWAEALQRNQRWLSTVIRSRLADKQAAEDVLQEVALAAISQESKPTDPAKVAPWLYRVALRKVINHHRSTGRRRRLMERAANNGTVTEEDRGPAPGDWLLKSETNHSVLEALRDLEEQDRQILLLKYSEGWGYQELAERLGVSIKTVEYRLLKARKAMRARLND